MFKKQMVWTALAVGASLVATAMPTKEDCQKVKMTVDELLSTDRVAVKNKKMTPVDAGEKAERLALTANDEASKYLLYQAALNYYVRGGDFDRAYTAVTALQGSVVDIPETEMARILRNGLRGVSAKNGGRLYTLLRDTENRVRYAKDIVALEKSLEKKPSDTTLQTRLGERHALLGDWKKALAAFAKADGELAQTARAELDGKSLAWDKIADFWWGYVVAGEDGSEESFKAHAGNLYKKALQGDGLDGIRRSLVEKRVKEAGELSIRNVESVFKISGNTAKLFLNEEDFVEFVKCPAGTFGMVVDIEKRKKVNVTLSRPFWFSKTIAWDSTNYFTHGKILSTRETLDALRTRKGIGLALGDVYKNMTSLMTERFKDALPPGYVVRLPTLAEWQYAFQANERDTKSPYYLLNYANWEYSTECGKIGKKFFDVHNEKREWRSNSWGIQDFRGREHVLDLFESKWWNNPSSGRERIARFPEQLPSKTDPLFWTEEEDCCATQAALWICGFSLSKKKDDWGMSHIVIGPDLVSEWKAKNGKKK